MKYIVNISFTLYFAEKDEEEAKKSIYEYVEAFLRWFNVSGSFKMTAEEIKNSYRVTKQVKESW